MINLGKKWSCAMTNLINIAHEMANLSPLRLRHGAVLFSKKSDVQYKSCNCPGDKIYGYDVPALHAEARCLKPITGRVTRLGRCHQGAYRL